MFAAQTSECRQPSIEARCEQSGSRRRYDRTARSLVRSTLSYIDAARPQFESVNWTGRCAIGAVSALAAAIIVMEDRFSSLAAPIKPTASATASGSKRIQLAAHDESVRDVLLRLGDLAHLNVTMADDVRGNVNLSLHDATPGEAVHAVCAQLQLRCARDGRTLMVFMQSSLVVPLAVIPSRRAVQVVRNIFPRLTVREDNGANALVLIGPPSDIQNARAVIQGLDVRDATKPATEGITLRAQQAQVVAQRLRALYRSAKIEVLSPTTLLVSAIPPDLTQIKTLIASIDMATPAPSAPPLASEAVKVLLRSPLERRTSSKDPAPSLAHRGVRLCGDPDGAAGRRDSRESTHCTA